MSVAEQMAYEHMADLRRAAASRVASRADRAVPRHDRRVARHGVRLAFRAHGATAVGCEA